MAIFTTNILAGTKIYLVVLGSWSACDRNCYRYLKIVFQNYHFNSYAVWFLRHQGLYVNCKKNRGSIWRPCALFKNLFSRERVQPCFLVTFNIIISHIFPDDFIEHPQVVHKISGFPPSILTIFIDFLDFLTFHCC